MTENTEKEFDQHADEAAEALQAIIENSVDPAEHPDGMTMQEWVFTNDKTNPAPVQLFRLFHEGAFKNKLGIMHAKVKGKDEIQTLIVGINIDGDNIMCFPLAKVLSVEEQDQYAYPDGNGGYFGE